MRPARKPPPGPRIPPRGGSSTAPPLPRRPNVFVAYDAATAAAVRTVLKPPDWLVVTCGQALLGHLFKDALVSKVSELDPERGTVHSIIMAHEWLQHLKTKVSGRIVFL